MKDVEIGSRAWSDAGQRMRRYKAEFWSDNGNSESQIKYRGLDYPFFWAVKKKADLIFLKASVGVKYDFDARNRTVDFGAHTLGA